MEIPYTYSNSTATSSSSSSHSNSSNPGYYSALHSVRRIPGKSVITKKPIAPMPPVPPKIYKVDPVDFMDVVQRLTAAPEFQRRRLQEVAPPPLSLSPPPVAKSSYDHMSNFGSASMSPLGFSLSPSSLAWCSTMLLSPKTLSSFEQSAVL